MRVITVSQLNRYVKMLLQEDVALTPVYVSGEISNFVNHYKSGHLYFSLKDENALVKAVMFRTYAARLAFRPESGMKVIVRAKASVYEKDGTFQLYVEDMQPDGVGALQIAYEQLKKRLQEEELFDPARKRKLPQFPTRVGVITSPTGAAVRDILNILARRYPAAQVVFLPVLVQGEGAPEQLVAALERMNREKAADVLIIGRGGGSLEELWSFNDERVCRAVAASEIPVISAVGHETDFTLCDFAADLRAPTPSAAAELAVPDMAELLLSLRQTQVQLTVLMRTRLEKARTQLQLLHRQKALSSPTYYVEQRAMQLDLLTRSFEHSARTALQETGARLSAAAAKLDALSPLKVLARGYAMAHTESGRVVTAVADVCKGDTLYMDLCDGTLRCTVEDIEGKVTDNG